MSQCSVSLPTTILFCMLSASANADGIVLGQTTWADGNQHRYAIVELSSANWAAASADIATILPGYHLATITSQAEQDFVWNFLVQTTGAGWEWWLGGFQDLVTETDPAEGWQWVTGEPWVYTNWRSGEPNNAGGIEDHLAFDGGRWNDEGTAISIIRGYVAEIAPPPVDVPDVVDESLAIAEANIFAAGLTVGEVNTEISETVPSGIVLNQDPPACNACLPLGSPVHLVVSDGPAIVPLALIDATIEGAGGLGVAILSGSTATWRYNKLTGIVTGSGFYSAQYQISQTIPGQLFTHNIVDLVVGGGNVAAATSYVCIEGTFGEPIGGHLCGNYNFGLNFINESLVTYGPGTAFSRAIGGDDEIVGTQQNLIAYGGMNTFFNGSTVFLSRPVDPDLGGYTMTFEVLPGPIPIKIDIAPGNAINLGARGVIPVAILTTDVFDAMQVDVTTLAFGPDSAGVAHQQGHVKQNSGQGNVDLIVHFRTEETGIACGDIEATLTGETYAGDAISGSAAVTTVGKNCK